MAHTKADHVDIYSLGDPKWEWFRIDPVTKEAIDLYFRKHKPTGGFLQRVIANDLTLAVQMADPYNLKTLPAITTYVHINPDWYGMGQAVGSYENYNEWIKQWSIDAEQYNCGDRSG